MDTITTIIKRNGKRVPFDKVRIFQAIEKAFLAENTADPAAVASVTNEIGLILRNRLGEETMTHVEEVQDIVEETLMRNGYLKVAKSYILYREKHKQARQQEILAKIKENKLEIILANGQKKIFNPDLIAKKLESLSKDLPRIICPVMVETITKQIYDQIPEHEVTLLILGSARERIEEHYEYASLAARIAIDDLYEQILNHGMNTTELQAAYTGQFSAYIDKGIKFEMLNPKLREFDLVKLAAAIQPDRDKLFYYLGVQILMDRYLLRDRSNDKTIYELPQWFWMRVAMGLAIGEVNREEQAIAFYNVLSQMDLVSSTPTLFNSGTMNSQMSSCYLNLADDSLQSIFKLYADNANLSKWAGGIGSDWTYIRATGSKIKGTNGMSQGVIPFIKIFNDVALAVNQGGKRKGAMCAYMEIWHLDFEQFMELKKNTGDERRRAHDINTAAWIPDLFMKRVQEDGDWTLFCPSEVPDLHDLYGKAFDERYKFYETQPDIRKRTFKAVDIWRRTLTMLYETGHPWITFKDACNVRNPQDHCGVIHSSNLCTEITLNTSKEETAVCNLASINLSNMIKNGQLDEEKLAKTIEVGIRMLDNVIDNNYYPIKEAETANLRHRAVGLGLMGFQDALYKLDIAFDSEENMEFTDASMEMISYYAILASSKLAKERGTYSSYEGSKWSKGLFPYDTVALLEENRGRNIQVGRKTRLDWNKVKEHVKTYGMRNSNTMAIAPTATIANISGVFPCTEPAYKNIYMKENLSGNFVVINRYLVDDLEARGLWNRDMTNKIKMADGSVLDINEIPVAVRRKYKEVFEIDPKWIIKSAALRSKWIDQSASTNVFISTTSGKILSDIYTLAWETGLKTTYYLRTLGASQVTKATTDTSTKNDVTPAALASIEDPDCEACQ